ncbi:dipeptidase 1-like [Aphis craccivora]|uniref:Dipeptidase 1-like n=1 Tax=Aphis craccivora TaxID=307492 RepID=A0A6G0ZID4_APHCR|nr:dipeptidase 1-like [Aphis craccivora]
MFLANNMVEQLLQERCGRQLSSCVRMNTRLAGAEFELNCGKKQSSRRSTEQRERGHVPGMFDREDVDLDLDLKYHLQTCTCSCNHMGFGNYMDYYQVDNSVNRPRVKVERDNNHPRIKINE